MKLRWYEYRVGSTWVKTLQYLDPTNTWKEIPTIQGKVS
jgi:hypothetical protein